MGTRTSATSWGAPSGHGASTHAATLGGVTDVGSVVGGVSSDEGTLVGAGEAGSAHAGTTTPTTATTVEMRRR